MLRNVSQCPRRHYIVSSKEVCKSYFSFDYSLKLLTFVFKKIQMKWLTKNHGTVSRDPMIMMMMMMMMINVTVHSHDHPATSDTVSNVESQVFTPNITPGIEPRTMACQADVLTTTAPLVALRHLNTH